MSETFDALLRLILAGGPLAPRRALLEQCGTPQKALAAGEARWRQAGLNVEQIARLRETTASRHHNRARRWLEQSDHHLLGWRDAAYPPLLRECRSPPLALFVDGDPQVLSHPQVAVVGSRSPTAGGRDNAALFATALARAGLAVGSGLAAGVDAAAHTAALGADGLTVAVVGTGPDRVYPDRHRDLHARIVASGGAVVSEYPPGAAARAAHFPSRNRILAALSVATLVVEAAERSGARITARLAADAGRDVFAVPGSIHNPLARGCHLLIAEGAGLVGSPEELLRQIERPLALLGALVRDADKAEAVPCKRPGPPRNVMDAHYHRLWLALGHDPTGMDQLTDRTGLTAAELSSMLLVMELDGQVTVEHGRYWRK